MTLPDGRRLAYAEWGDRNGAPVFFFHGTPHSRLWCPDEDATRRAKVRLITIDRPGIGRSDIQEARTYADWTRDVADLADALQIQRFVVVGWSSGGPYAGACAALIAPRLAGIGIVSTRHLGQYNFVERPDAYEELGPDERAEFDLAQSDPRAAAELAAVHSEGLLGLAEDAGPMHESLKTAEGDLGFFEDEGRVHALDVALRECFRQGMDGLRWELIDGWLPWGFRLADIKIPVHVWHGAQDRRIKQEHVDFIGSTIRDCRVVIWPDCGHLGIAKHWDEILETLT